MARYSHVLLASALALSSLVACSEDKPIRITPEMALDRDSIEFGAVRLDTSAEDTVVIHSRARAALSIESLTIEDDPEAPGGAAAFSVPAPLESVDAEADANLTVAFKPAALQDYSAVLVVKGDDPDPRRTEQRVSLKGHGALPKVRVLPECKNSCTEMTATEAPPAIDFGTRPMLRKNPSGTGFINPPVWPSVSILNDGEIPLKLLKVAFEGDPAFSSPQSLNTEGVTIEQGSGQVIFIIFNPADAKTDYAADLVVKTDDPNKPEVRVHLTGKLAPNKPPVACAAIVKVEQPDGQVDIPSVNGQPVFDGTRQLVPVQPGENAKTGTSGKVFLSAFSDHFVAGLHPNESTKGDLSKCTTDPEDGRQVLTYQWSIVSRPKESQAVISNSTSAEPYLKPDAVGHYSLKLQVKDPQGAVAEATVDFDALPQRDIVVQLTWQNQADIDLDVHLVKPGPCNGGDCVFDRKGDMNGISSFLADQAGTTLDWGELNKAYDDPRLDFDDQGNKALIENVNLNRPENDPACATARCTYDVYVHYFKDARTTSGSGPVCPTASWKTTNPTGKCQEGDECGCSGSAAGSESVCVSSHCVKPVQPVVKIFIKPTPQKPNPDLVIPLPPSGGSGESVSVGGPCFMWHVARITWPSKAEVQANPNYASLVSVSEVGTINNREFSYYGRLDPGNFACAPNSPTGTQANFLLAPWTDRPEYK